MDEQQNQEMNSQTGNSRSKKKLIYGVVVFIIIAILIFLAISFKENKKENDNIMPVDDVVADDKIIEIDSDSDGLLDDEESLLGTDKFKSDTDDDGYSDLAEIKNGYNPLGEGKTSEELNKIAEEIILKIDQRLLGGFIKKYNNLEEYNIEYKVYTASEERSNLGPEDESSYNTKSGSSFVQKTYKKGNNFRTDNDGFSAKDYKVFFTFNGNMVNDLEELYINGQYISCGGGTCQKNNQYDFFEWDWNFFQNPNLFYYYLTNNNYAVEHLESVVDTETKRKCEVFKIILDKKIYIKNVAYINGNKSRKAEINIRIDSDTGTVVSLFIFAQSDAKSENENKLHDIMSWYAQNEIITTVSDEDILQKGKYAVTGKAWDKNEAVVIVEPYVSGSVSGSIKFFNSDNTILKEIELDKQNFVGQEKKKLIIKHNLNLEKEIKYELCLGKYCKIIEPSTVSQNYNCFKNSLEKINCEKVDGCFYNDDLCLKFECISILVKDKKLCEENGCYWIEDEGGHDRCFDYLCKFRKDDNLCSESENCVWSNSLCVDKKCNAYNKKETCEASDLKCFWTGFRCYNFSCLHMNSENECIINNECAWKEEESEGAGVCKSRSGTEENLPNCLYLEENDCVEEELCLWKESKCFYNICNGNTNAQCKNNEKCYWEPYGSCVDK